MFKNKSLKFLTVIISAVLTIQMSAAAFYAVSQQDTADEVVIFHTNDMHGYVTYSEGSCIGLDRVAALKSQTDNSILVDAGDATQGAPFASLTKGADVIDVMNAAGYDLMAAGNHEFDYGYEQLLQNAEAADFPILAANVYKDSEPLLKSGESNGCHTVVEVDDKSIGFFGLTTAETATATNPEGIKGVEFRDEIESAKHEIEELSALGVDAIVAVAHLGEYTTVPCDSAKLAEAVAEEYPGMLTAIIDGHSHTPENKVVDDVLIVQTGTALSDLGKLTLSFDENGGVTAEGVLIDCDEAAGITPDSVVADKINEINENQHSLLSQEVCKLDNTLWGGYINGIADARIVETNLGDLAADAYRDSAQSFIANAPSMEKYKNTSIIGVENGGGIRSTIYNGTVTKGDLVSAFPFSNTLIMKEITPKTLYDILEVSVGSITGQNAQTGLVEGQLEGGFLQVSGILFTYNPSAEAGSKVEDVVLDGSYLELDRNDDETPLILVSNNFIMNGGSGYNMLASIDKLGEIGGELETVEAYIISQADQTNTFRAETIKGRININGGYLKDEYTAKILVLNDDKSPAIQTEVSLYVDGSYYCNAVTDGDGYVSVTVPDGPHGVSLSLEQRQVYVNNYTAAGVEANEYRALPTLDFAEAQVIEPTTDPEETTEPEEEQPTETPAPEGNDAQSSTSDQASSQPAQSTATPDSASGNGTNSIRTGDVGCLAVYSTLALLALAVAYAKGRKRAE